MRNYGGDFEIARDTSLLDDRFEVVLFAGRSSYALSQYFTAVALKRVRGMKGVTVLRARKVCLSAPQDPRVHIQVDGEYAGKLPGSVEIVPDALTLLIPPGYMDRVTKPDGRYTLSVTRRELLALPGALLPPASPRFPA